MPEGQFIVIRFANYLLASYTNHRIVSVPMCPVALKNASHIRIFYIMTPLRDVVKSRCRSLGRGERKGSRSARRKKDCRARDSHPRPDSREQPYRPQGCRLDRASRNRKDLCPHLTRVRLDQATRNAPPTQGRSFHKGVDYFHRECCATRPERMHVKNRVSPSCQPPIQDSIGVKQ